MEMPNPSSIVPLSPQQQRMIFLHELDATNIAYNTGACFRLRGPVDTDRLFRAVRAVVERHSVLRTSFALADGVPLGWIRDSATFDWELLDLRKEPKRVGDDEGRQRVRERLERRMDLARSAVGVLVVRLADDDCLFALLLHHIVCDAWSMTVFLEEVTQEYDLRPQVAS